MLPVDHFQLIIYLASTDLCRTHEKLHSQFLFPIFRGEQQVLKNNRVLLCDYVTPMRKPYLTRRLVQLGLLPTNQTGLLPQ
jgi:hypothetical protein